MKLLRRKLCECGCGEVVKRGNRFIINHHRKGKKMSEEFKKKHRIIMLNRYKDPKEREKTGKLSRKYWSILESREKASKSSIEINSRPEVKEMRREHMLNRYKDPKEREKTSNQMKKHCSDPKVKEYRSKLFLEKWSNPEFRKKTIKAQKEGYNKPGVREGMSRRLLERWSNPEFKEKTILKIIKTSGTKPNKPEKKLNKIIQKLFPGEYKLNVKANIMTLGGKVPDFVNVNGKKKLVELWGDYWHRSQNPNDRINYFKQFGWNTLVVWERELKKENLLKARLINFHEKGIDSCLLRR